MSRGIPFQPGNKFGRGRPPGSRNKSNLILQRLTENANALISKGQLLALQKGDPKLLIWCLNELVRKRMPALKLKLPPIKTLDDITRAHDVVLNAVANNKCTSADGQVLSSMLDERRKMIETQNLAARLEELEKKIAS